MLPTLGSPVLRPSGFCPHERGRPQWHRFKFWTCRCACREGPPQPWSAVWDAALQRGEGGLGFSGPVTVIRALSIPAALGRSGSIQKLPCLSHVFQRAVTTGWQGSAGIGNVWRGEELRNEFSVRIVFSSDFVWAASHLGMFVKCLKKQASISLCFHSQHVMPWSSMYTNHFFFFLLDSE